MFKLIRETFTDKTTIGKLYMDDQFQCHTLEDTVRELGPNGEGKVCRQTAIPAGVYEITITWSERFKRLMPLVNNVPFFKGVRIHMGNTDADTDGCILVGKSTGPDRINESREAFSLLFLVLKREAESGKLMLTIEEKRDAKI